MMEWTMPDTVTAGVVMFAALSVVAIALRNMGKRADPKLMDFLKSQDDNHQKANERFAKSFDRNTDAIEKMTGTLDMLSSNTTTTFESIGKQLNEYQTSSMRLIETLIGHISGEHGTQAERLESLEKTLKEKQQVDKGLVEVMGDGMKSQAKTNGDILALLKEIKDELKSIRQSNTHQYGETLKRLDKTDQTVANIEQKLKDETEKDKSNVQSTEQHNGLADPSGVSGGTDQHDSRDASQAVPPRATGTDTKREDDQSKSAIS